MPSLPITVHEPSVAMHLVRVTGEYLSTRGVAPETFRHYVGVSAVELARPEGRLDVRRYRQARKLVEDTGRLADHLDRVPLAWTQWISKAWPEIPALCFNSPTLGDALRAYARYRPLIGNVDAVRCDVDGDQLVVSYTPDPQVASCLMSAVSHFTILQDLVAHYRERLDMPISMHVDIGELGRPFALSQLTDILQMPLALRPGVRTHRLVVQGPAVWMPVSGHHPLSSGWAREALEGRLQALSQTRPSGMLMNRIEDLIEACWQEPGADDSMADVSALQQHVAHTLGMSRWTLRRSLADHQMQFSELLDGLRARRLPALMSDPNLSLLNVGARLGFASQSTFSRYFRSRYGHPPSRDPAWMGRC